MDSSNHYSFAKKEILKICIAIFVLMLVSTAYYLYIRGEALHDAEKKAEVTLKSIERMILIRMGKIETTVNAMQSMVEYALDDPDAMYDIALHTFESSSRIMGAGIAFKADYYPEKGHWYETYVGYQKGTDSVVTKQLGCPEHDYLQMEWFKKGMESTDGFWSNPYYDNAGGKDYMVSYCLPFFDSTDIVVGVICTDITLDTLASIIRGVKLFPNSFCTLYSSDSTVLVAPPANHKIKGKSHVFTEKIDGKNLTLTLTIPDADMYMRLRRNTLFFVLLALTGILSVFFIAYRSIQNLWQLNEVRAREQRIEDELTIARNIQQSLLPSTPKTGLRKNIDICGMQVPARFVGGDLYDYYVRDNKLIFCIGDVSGKGVPAALLMSISHSLFRTLSARNESPENITQALNIAISENNPDIMFITMFLGIMDLETGVIRYCNAGHNPPMIVRKDGVSFVDTEPCLLFGVEPKAKYTAHELVLAPGESLVLYTDGLTEAENTKKELFGEKRAEKTAAACFGMTAAEQLDRMWNAVHQFVDQAEQSDDFTMLVIRYTPEAETITMTNDFQELERLEPFLNGFFDRNNLDSTLLPSMDLALEEALTNIIMYAYPEGKKGEMTLIAMVESNVIHFEISDQGVPFNPLLQKEADLDVPLKERQIGGLGIHLIKEIMDEVEYANEGGRNILKMRKKV